MLTVVTRFNRLVVADADGKIVGSVETGGSATARVIIVRDTGRALLGEYGGVDEALIELEKALVIVPTFPIDCELAAEWNDWTTTNLTTCIGSLRTRTEERTRNVVTEPSSGGTACGTTWETRDVEEACSSAVDCGLSVWGAWELTTAFGACVNGLQTGTETRTRTVVTEPADGGAACGVLSETRQVTQACVADVPPPTHCAVSAFGTWTTTAVSACVGDLQTRTEQRSRTIVTQPANGGTACPALTETRDTEEACVTPVDCVLAVDWNAWVTTDLTECVGSLHTRTEERTRSIVVQPVGTGAICGPTFETRETEEACTMPGVESVNGTRGATVTDNELAVWTLGANGATLRNGVNFNFGQGSEYLYWAGVVYHKGNNGHYYSGGSPWVDGGLQDPSLPTMSVDHFRVPDDGPSITDNVGRVWTLVNGQDVYVNGAYFFGGWANMLLFEHDDLFVHLRRPNTLVWHHRDEAATPPWVDTGTDDPETGPVAPPPPGPVTGVYVSTCSMTNATNTITVANPDIFPVNAWVIIPVGYEGFAGAGQRGCINGRGIGGAWPEGVTYANQSAMQADLANRGTGVWTYVRDTGHTFFKFNNVWNKQENWDRGKYYNAKALPHAYQAKVLSKSGNQLTMTGGPWNGVAQASVPAGTPVYRDVAPLIDAAIAAAANGSTINLNTLLGAADAPVGGCLHMTGKTGITLKGNGIGTMRLYAPKGGPPAQIEVNTCTNCVIEHFTLNGNWGDHGYFPNAQGSTLAASNNPVQAGGAWPQGVSWGLGVFVVASSGVTVRNMHAIDTGGYSFRSLGCTSATFRDNKSTLTYAQRDYLGWQHQHDNGVNCKMFDPELVADYATPAFELFACSGTCAIYRPKGRNATMAINNSGGWTVGKEAANPTLGAGELRYTANAFELNRTASPEAGYAYINPIPNNAALQINSAAGTNNVAPGGTVLDLKIIQEGYLTTIGNSLVGVVVGDFNPEVTVDGLYYQAPNYYAGASGNGAQAVTSGGHHGILKNITCIGTSKGTGQYANIVGFDVTSPALCTNNVAGTTYLHTI